MRNLLFLAKGRAPRREGAMIFNDCRNGIKRINTTWSSEEYRQLRALSHALCVSVSHLCWIMLGLVGSVRGRSKAPVTRHRFTVLQWSAKAICYREMIYLSSS